MQVNKKEPQVVNYSMLGPTYRIFWKERRGDMLTKSFSIEM